MTLAARRVLAAMIAILGLTLTVLYVSTGLAPKIVEARTGEFRLPSVDGGKINIATDIDTGTLRQAVRAAPISQPVFNAAMVAAIAKNPQADRRSWMKALRSLGWRDTVAQQNLIADAIIRQDVGTLVASADSLLRRNTVILEATQVMNLAEAYPETWPQVFALLKDRVDWRYAYLERAGSMTVPAVLDGRAKTLTALMRAGDRLEGQEVRPFVFALVNAGRIAEADRLWRAYTNDNSNLIHDSQFRQALALGSSPATPHPFLWSLGSGYGYSVGIDPNGLGSAVVTLQWDGRGVPVFLSQMTSAKPGRLRLRIKVEGDQKAFGERIGARLRCDDLLTPLLPVPRPGATDLVLETEKASPCEFPTIQIFGIVQPTTREFDGALSGLILSSIS